MITKSAFIKLCRFGIAGGASTLLYAVFAFCLGALLPVKFIYIHVLAFALAIPFSYFMQRGFTFRHKGSHRQTSWRFLVATSAAFIVSSLVSFYLVDILGAPHWLGIAAVMCVVPVTSFLTMRYWVFIDRQ